MAMMHLLDEITVAFGEFDLTCPRGGPAGGFCLQFSRPLIEPRREEIEDVLVRMTEKGDTVVGLAFWLPQHRRFRDAEEALALLAENGLGHEGDWHRRTIALDAEAGTSCLFFSQRVELQPPSARLLSELVARMDHGAWQGIAPSVYLWVRPTKVLVRFWDDRGADVRCLAPDVLASYRERLAPYVAAKISLEVWQQ